MRVLAILLIYAGAYFVCAQSEIFANLSPLIGFALLPVVGKILE